MPGLPLTIYKKIEEKIAVDIALCSPQLYNVVKHNFSTPVRADSSSILIKIDNKHFLISAGHSFYQVDLKNIGVMIENDFIALGGTLNIVEPNLDDVYDPNLADIAIWELDEETTSVLQEKYQFLNWDKVDVHLYVDEAYLVFGYPGSLTNKNFSTKMITPKPLILATIGKPNEFYQKERIDQAKILALLVDQKKVGRKSSDKIEELPDLGGISGCGIWYITDMMSENPDYKLVGILTGENEDKTILYSTKINIVQSILARHFGVVF